MTMEKVGLIAGNGKLPKLFSQLELRYTLQNSYAPLHYLPHFQTDKPKMAQCPLKYTDSKIIPVTFHFQQLDLLFPLSFFIFPFLFFL